MYSAAKAAKAGRIPDLKTDNFHVKNKSCRDPEYQMFVSQQLNDLTQHTQSRYDYLKTHLSRAGV